MAQRASALSHHDFRVDRLQFNPRVADLQLPVDAALPGVAVLIPCDPFLFAKRRSFRSVGPERIGESSN